MAYLKVYRDGTPGGTDGTEITPGSTLIAKGAWATYEASMCDPITISLRCDAGHSAASVTITFSKSVYIWANGSYWATSETEFDYWFPQPMSTITTASVGTTNMSFLIAPIAAVNENGIYNDLTMTISFTEV